MATTLPTRQILTCLALPAFFPYRLHTVLTDNGIQFTSRPNDRSIGGAAFRLAFDRVCREHGIQHRLTKVEHPWTNGQVKRMNRTLKEATVARYGYESHAALREHLATVLAAYNQTKRLRALKGLTPQEFVCQEWARAPDQFVRDPDHDTPGPYKGIVLQRLSGSGRS